MRLRVILLVLALLVGGAPVAVAAPDRPVKEKLRTKCDEAWFWSGRVDGESVQGMADDLARQAGGVTLGQKLARERIPEPGDLQGWDLYSRYFAEGARCEVRAVHGSSLRPDNIWEKTEFPALQRNRQITYVWVIKAWTREACVVWKQPVLPDKRCYYVQ
jgi:hypothetical protein